MALRAGEIELALPARERRAAVLDELSRVLVVGDRDRLAARLPADEGGERQQLLALVSERLLLLPIRAAHVDALLEIDRPAERRAERRIARGDAFHAGRARRHGSRRRTWRRRRLAVPQRLAVEHPQHAGVGGVVVLHRAGLARHEVVAGLALGEGNFGDEAGKAADDRKRMRERRCARSHSRHSTVMATDSVAWKPLSPVQVIVMVPLSVATVVKATYGLAETAGKNSARNTSTPL